MLVSVSQVSGKDFDYVVVGGGTAGLVVAARLSEDPNISVLVVEAGSDNLDDSAILTPAAFGSHFGKPQYDWAFSTVPQSNCFGRSVYWARGKGLGGSSAINFFQYHRPAKSDLDAIGKLGNSGWNWDLWKRYYAKSEHFIQPDSKADVLTFDVKEHGKDGPLHTAYPITLSGFENPYHESLKALGINRVNEPFTGNTKGTWLTPVSIHPERRVRSYAANMYYQPNAERENLKVLCNAKVSKLVLKKDSDIVTATGVSFVCDGQTHSVGIVKEVVLCAGAIMSPQILEWSGIGDPTILKKAGIDTVVDLPGVGNNVQEHVYSGASYEVREERENEFLTFDCLRDPEQLKLQQELYKNGKGVYGMASICLTFVPLSAISPDAVTLQTRLRESIQDGIAQNRYPSALKKQLEIQLHHIQQQEPSCELVLTQTFSSKPKPPVAGKKYVTLTCLLNHPFSRGTIHVKSNNPADPPIIDPHYFEEEYDLKSFVEMMKFNRRLSQQEPLRSILGPEVNPGPECTTDEQIADFLKAQFNTTYHTIGSCSMLPLEDDGVVDTNLKVYHTTNIRVVDISILPLQIGAHLQATAYALGEIGADIIKGVIRP